MNKSLALSCTYVRMYSGCPMESGVQLGLAYTYLIVHCVSFLYPSLLWAAKGELYPHIGGNRVTSGPFRLCQYHTRPNFFELCCRFRSLFGDVQKQIVHNTTGSDKYMEILKYSLSERVAFFPFRQICECFSNPEIAC